MPLKHAAVPPEHTARAAAELRRAVPWAIGFGAAPRAVAVIAPNAGVLDQWVAHIGRAGGDVFVYAGAAREKLAHSRVQLGVRDGAHRLVRMHQLAQLHGVEVLPGRAQL